MTNSNFIFFRQNWLRREFFALLPDQLELRGGDDLFSLFYGKSKPQHWFYFHGVLETLCETDLVRVMGNFEVEGICRQTLYLPDNTSREVLVFSWYTRTGQFRGLVVDPKDKSAVAFALQHMKSRSGCLWMNLKHHLYLQVFLTLWLLSIFMLVNNEYPTPRQLGASYFGAAIIAASARKAAS